MQTYPAKEFVVLTGPMGIPELKLGVVLLDQIFQDISRLPDMNLLAITESIRDGWDFAIGVNLEIPRFFLRLSAEVVFVDPIRDIKFLQQNRGFVPIWRLGGI